MITIYYNIELMCISHVICINYMKCVGYVICIVYIASIGYIICVVLVGELGRCDRGEYRVISKTDLWPLR